MGVPVAHPAPHAHSVPSPVLNDRKCRRFKNNPIFVLVFSLALYYHGQIFDFPAQIPINHKGHEVTQRKFGMIVFPGYLGASR
jgi:hypothetical protein